ncbi:hypothetical protein DQ04_00781000 [Trypanosoma grayi]|uniref:hypothetical protein n=1 Tax=Trypanosoma grayi TaxID=71804 RepID=UPI0004F49458|nr:hypothetical protein DQ04_00781000 [Trypanosoma grayi]KEG13789.1 hypothetical protein DQ04_00781000 [Trypanosoma grayi]
MAALAATSDKVKLTPPNAPPLARPRRGMLKEQEKRMLEEADEWEDVTVAELRCRIREELADYRRKGPVSFRRWPKETPSQAHPSEHQVKRTGLATARI